MTATLGRGFALHVVASFGDQPTYDDPDGAWARFLATAPLDTVAASDRDIERVAAGPLRILLHAAGARAFAERRGGIERRFVVTLDDARLYAGRIVFIGTARALRHPIIHVHDDGLATTLVVLPHLGARGDSELTAPPALLAHFAGAGKLVPPGKALSPHYRRRSWSVELSSSRAGEQTVRIAAGCIDGRCSVDAALGRPGAAPGVYDPYARADLDCDEFEDLWHVIERDTIARLQPVPGGTNVVPLHPPSIRITLFADRGDGSPVVVDASWTSPSSSDPHAHAFLRGVASLVRRRLPAISLRAFLI